MMDIVLGILGAFVIAIMVLAAWALTFWTLDKLAGGNDYGMAAIMLFAIFLFAIVTDRCTFQKIEVQVDESQEVRSDNC